MKLTDWLVLPNDDGFRPAGKPDECFYCDQKVGSQHGAECVMREQTVLVRLTIDLVIRRPEHWDADAIEFHANEGTSCANNWVDELKTMTTGQGCLCHCTTLDVLREATAEDEEEFGVFVADRKTK